MPQRLAEAPDTGSTVATSDRADETVTKMVESQLHVCRQIEILLVSTPPEAVEQRRQAYEMLQVHIGMYWTYVQWLPAKLQAQYGLGDDGDAGAGQVATQPGRACVAEGAMADQCKLPAHRADPPNRKTRGHVRSQTGVLVLGALGACLARWVVDDTSYFSYICIGGGFSLLVLAAAAQWLSIDAMAYAWARFIAAWPLIRDAAILLLREQTEATTAQTVEQVQVALYWTQLVFFLLGILHHMVPKSLRWRLRALALFAVINVLSTSQMVYPHLGDTPPIFATCSNEIGPFVAGFTSVLLVCGNAHGREGYLPVWPRVWTRGTDDFVAPS